MSAVNKVGLGAGIGGLIALGLTGYLWLSAPSTLIGDSRQPGANSPGTQGRDTKAFGPKAVTPPVDAQGRASGAASERSGGPAAFGSSEVPAPLFGKRQSGEGGASNPPTSTDAVLGGVAIGRNGAPSLNHIQARLQALVAQGRQPTAREVDLVLADLQRNQGTDVVSGVNLQVMRDNLSHTERIEQIAREIQAIAANPAKVDPSRIPALVAEMQRRQAAMVSPMVSTAQR